MEVPIKKKKKPAPKKKATEPENFQVLIATHPNGLIVVQLSQPLQSIFLSAEEATAIAKALLVEARRVKINETLNPGRNNHSASDDRGTGLPLFGSSNTDN
jgi:hypothetical protein